MTLTKHLMIGADPADLKMSARLGYAYAFKEWIVLRIHIRPLPISDKTMEAMLRNA